MTTETTVSYPEPPLPALADGWAFWRGDECNGMFVCATKASLLVSFDMMSLRGLAACEAHMGTKSWIIKPTRFKLDPASTWYTAAIGGRFDLDMGEWSVVSQNNESTLKTVAFYLEGFNQFYSRSAPPDNFPVTEAERRQLRTFFWMDRDSQQPTLPEDKRRRTTLSRARVAVLAICQRFQIEVVPFTLEVVEELK